MKDSKLIKYQFLFENNVAWDKQNADKFCEDIKTEKEENSQQMENAKKDFIELLTDIPEQYRGMSQQGIIKDINRNNNTIEEKWQAINEKLQQNYDRIRAIEGENQTYKDYVEAVKSKQEIEDQAEQLTDENIENHFETLKKEFEKEDGFFEAIVNNEKLKQMNNSFGEIKEEYKQLIEQEPKDIGMEEVIQWKRAEYYNSHPKKKERTLQKINKKIQRINRFKREEEKIPEATEEDLYNNTQIIQDINFRGKNRFALIARLPILGRSRYRKEYYEAAKVSYEDTIDRICKEEEPKAIDNATKEAIKEFRNKLRENVNENQTQREEFINSQYQNLVRQGEQEREER